MNEDRVGQLEDRVNQLERQAALRGGILADLVELMKRNAEPGSLYHSRLETLWDRFEELGDA